MEKPIADYNELMRVALVDPGTMGVYAYSNEQLAAAIRSTLLMGLGPKGVSVKTGDPSKLDPAPETPDATGFMVLNAALQLIGGQVPVGFKTRAMSVSISPFERQATIEHLRRQIQKIEKDGDPHGRGGNSCFGIWADMENALCRTTDPERIA